MNLPVKVHYATVAMLALAREFARGGIATARAIADEHEIPSPFLIQIFQQLRSAGLVSSTRGSSGGFRLERSPAAISLFDIVEAVSPSASPQISTSESTLVRGVQEFWARMEADQNDLLRQMSLLELLERSESASESMFYI